MKSIKRIAFYIRGAEKLHCSPFSIKMDNFDNAFSIEMLNGSSKILTPHQQQVLIKILCPYDQMPC